MQASGDQMRMGLSGFGDRLQGGAGSDDVGEVVGESCDGGLGSREGGVGSFWDC